MSNGEDTVHPISDDTAEYIGGVLEPGFEESHGPGHTEVGDDGDMTYVPDEGESVDIGNVEDV